MYNIKIYIIKIIVLTFMIQLSGIFVKKQSFKKSLNLISGIILICIVLNIPVSEMTSISKSFELKNFKENNVDFIGTKFTESVSDMIKKDLSAQFGFSGDITVVSDLNHMNITVHVATDCDKKSIENYIKNKYCTENDEVKFADEFNRKIE